MSLSGRPALSPYLALLAFTLVLVSLQRSRSALQAALVTAVASTPMFVVAYEGVLDLSPVAFATVVLLSTLPFGAVGVACWWAKARSALWPWLLPFAWVAVETLTRQFPSPFTNPISIGLSQVDSPLLLLARWGGISLVALAVLLANVSAFHLLIVRRRMAVTVGVVVLLAGGTLVSSRVPATSNQTALSVVVVQGVLSNAALLAGKYDAVVARDLMDTYRSLTPRGTNERRLVVWPESVLAQPATPSAQPFEPRAFLEPSAALLAGGFFEEAGHKYNSAFLWSDAAVQRYDKRFLAPVFERNLARGTREQPLSVFGTPLGVSICWESLVAGQMREQVRSGAEFLTVITNDMFTGRTGTSAYHTKVSRLRAIELGRYVVHASQGGPSAVYAPDGRRVVHLGLHERGAIIAAVHGSHAITPYVRWGDWVGALSILLVLVCGIIVSVHAGGRLNDAGTRRHPPAVP